VLTIPDVRISYRQVITDCTSIRATTPIGHITRQS